MYPYEVHFVPDENVYYLVDARDGSDHGVYRTQVAAVNEAQRLYHIMVAIESPTGRGPGAPSGFDSSASTAGGAGNLGANMEHGWTLHGGAYRG